MKRAFCLWIVSLVTVPSGLTQQVYGGAGYAAVGIVHVEVSQLNAALNQKGFAGFKNFGISSGVFGYGLLGQFIIGGEFHSVSSFQTEEWVAGTSELGATMWSIDAGYLVHHTTRLFIYPLIGIGTGEFHLQLTKDLSRTFDEAISTLSDNVYMVRRNLCINIGVRLDLMIVGGRGYGGGGGLYVELNPGYTFDISGSGWKISGRELSGGPMLRLQGPYLRLMLGMGGFAYR